MRLKSICWASAAAAHKIISAAKTAPTDLTSAALESGHALLAQRAQAFAQVLRGLALADTLADPGDVGLGLRELLDGPLHVGHGKRRKAGELGRGLVDAGVELGTVDQPVEVSDAQKIFVGKILRQQKGALGEARTDFLGIA